VNRTQADKLKQDVISLAMDARLLGEARMLRDDQEVTPEIQQAIIRRFRELLERIGKSETWAAKSMGIAPSTLSQVLSGNYAGDGESKIRSIDKWTDSQIARENTPRPDGFARTSVSIEIIGAAKVAQKTGRIVVVHGPSGIGKSLTADFVLSETPGAIRIRLTTAGVGVTAIYDMLSRELKLPRVKLTAYQTELAVKEVLRDTRRLIIVDEVHKLCNKRKDQGLHVLRDLHDETGCPMLWLGTADIADYIENGREAVEAVEQIYGRVAWWLDLTYAASRADGGPGLHTVDDIRKVLSSQQIRVTPEAERYLADLANEPKMGGLRTIVLLGLLAKAKAGDRPISLELLSDMQGDRLGRRASQMLHKTLELRKRKVG
jgi:DNA transposition AAA+ family ATPase